MSTQKTATCLSTSKTGLRALVLKAYRDLLKAERETFHGDFERLQAARDQTKKGFLSNANEINQKAILEKVDYAQKVAQIIRKNVVQAVSEDPTRTSFRVLLRESHELGDNYSIKTVRERQIIQGNSKIVGANSCK
ncbi:hypothetical protein G9A89_010056 [Geosiphon pyriformis]|nr:hypothetical protein G9A89_010056 [Geosiphon pyriformis]